MFGIGTNSATAGSPLQDSAGIATVLRMAFTKTLANLDPSIPRYEQYGPNSPR